MALDGLGLLMRDRAATHLVGMPWEHAQIFMQIARQEKCVISSRQLGRVCMGLISAGYDSKGFRIKSKSCDFGPMAGFLCFDERFHKKGAAYNPTQLKDIQHAIHGDAWDTTGRWKAGTAQICLTQERLAELQNWNDPQLPDARIAPVAVTPEILVGTVARPIALNYVLRRERRFGDDVWAVYSAAKSLPLQPVVWRAAWEILVGNYGIQPILGMVNPYPPYAAGHYKNCCTGDYDLFGVWPLRRLRGSDALRPGHPLATPVGMRPTPYQALGEDRRIAGMAPVRADVDAQIFQWEDKRLGNISNRVHTVAQMINSAVDGVTNRGGGGSRNVVQHSDEAGRPVVGGIDDHVIAFIPAPGLNLIVGMESPGGAPNAAQWKAFFQVVHELGFEVVLNTHWMHQIAAWGLGGMGTTGDARGWRPAQNSPVRSN